MAGERIIQDIPEQQKKLLLNLMQDYDILQIYKLNQTKDEIISSGSTPRRCRFCGRSEPEVSFNKRAHAVSELCGSHHLLTDYECDECNAKFSKYERQFSQFMLFYHSVLGVEGKKGIPTYQRDRKETTGVVHENGVANLRSQVNEKPFVKIDPKNNKLAITGTRTYVPSDVYRSLLKIALTLTPESEMQYLQDALNCLNDHTFVFKESKQVALRVYSGEINVIRPSSVQLYKRKTECNNHVPAYLFALSYSNFTFQMYIPGCSLDLHLSNVQKVEVPLIPTVADGYFPFQTETLDLNSDQLIMKEPVPITFQFEGIEGKWLVPWWKRIVFYAEQLWFGIKRIKKTATE